MAATMQAVDPQNRGSNYVDRPNAEDDGGTLFVNTTLNWRLI
jgi:hypothetical protein